VSWAALCTTLMREKPTTPTVTTPNDTANNAWMITPARLGRAIGAGIMESQWDGCMLFSCLAHDPGKIGIIEDYQGKLGAVTGPGAHNSLSVHRHRHPCGLAGEQDRCVASFRAIRHGPARGAHMGQYPKWSGSSSGCVGADGQGARIRNARDISRIWQ